jgi:hypothetical protein
MAELLLVNPRRRRRKTKSRRRRKTASRRRSYRRRRRALAIAAPRRRRRRSSYRRIARRRRSNPSMRGIVNQFMPTLKSGFVGALGGLGMSVALGQVLPRLPVAMQSGWGKVGVKLLTALGVGMLGGYVMRGRGRALSEGAMTVVLYDVLKEQFAAFAPTVPLGEYLTYAPVVGYDSGGAAMPGTTGMGEYMSDYVTGAGSGVAYDSDVYGGY